MSWRIAAFAILGLLLVGGLAWYERSRPSSRIVALVAALAALAVAGRLAFAPIPNVQATTDIVLFTGFALGAAPGFAVGALAALVSNLWLGQGPWTPWEMAGWGIVGMGGAALGALTGRRLGRAGLAIACGAAGILYGVLLDFSVMATAGGALSLDRYLAVSARSVPFNLAHALGNVVLALAVGPALVRMISRYRRRLEFRWRAELAAPLLVVVLALPALAPGQADARQSPASWLRSARNADGGFGSAPGSSSSPQMTGWAVLGLEAAGTSPQGLGRGSANPISYLRRHASSITSTGDLERTILALEAAGADPRNFAGRDLVDKLAGRRSGSGSFSSQVNLTAFGILALRSAGLPGSALRRSANWLVQARNHDGGWGFRSGIASDPDSTGAALQGIALVRPGATAIDKGVRYLRGDQNSDGGWPLGGSGPSNTQSTAWAIQGLIAAGVRPGAVAHKGRSGRDYLSHRRGGDGHFRYSASSDQTPVWVTGQALMAASGQALPLAKVLPTRHTHSSSGSSGGGSGGGSGDSSGGTGATSTAETGTTPTPNFTPIPPGSGIASNYLGGGAAPGPSSAPHPYDPSQGGKGKAQSPAARDDTAAPVDVHPRLVAGVPVPRAQDPTAEAPSSGGGDSHTLLYVLIATGALALAGGGWYYRRWYA